jgi:hypothetical protein
MPERNDLFQRIVAIVYSQLTDGAVEESAMLPDRAAGT